MHFAGNELLLFLSLHLVQAFIQISIQALNPEISVFSTYKFTILTSFDPINRYITSGDTLFTTFPSEVPLIDTSTPSTCYRIDASSVQHSLPNCEIGPGNAIGFTLNVTVDTVVSPLVYVLGAALNPSAVITTSSFQLSQYRAGTLIDSMTSGLTATYQPGSLGGLSLQASNLGVNAQATYTITFSPVHNIPQFGNLLIKLPTTDFQLGSQATLVVTGWVNSAAAASLTATEPQTNQVLAAGLFVSSMLLASSNPVVTITIYPVSNPDSMRKSQSLVVYTTTQDGHAIDMGSSGMTVTPNAPGAITNIGVTATPPTVSLYAMYSFNMSPALSFPSGGKLTVTVPASISLGTVTCSFLLGFTPNGGSCGLSGQTISTSGVYYTKSSDNLYLVFTVSGLTNPPDTVSTSFFQISTYDSLGNLMCQNLLGPKLTASPNVISITNAYRTYATVSAPGPYFLSFSLATAIPESAKIKIVLPQDQVLQTASGQISCNVVAGNVVLPNNLCSIGVTATGSTYVILMTEWCSSNVAGCPIGTVLTVSFSGVSNLPYAKSPITSSIEIYTWNTLMTGMIDAVSSGQVFTPALQPANLLDAAVSRVGDTVGKSTIFYFSFTPTITFVAGAAILLGFPQSAVYPDPAGASLLAFMVKSTLDTPTSTSYTSLNLYSDSSIRSITLNQVCSSGCPTSVTLYFEITTVSNPGYALTMPNSYIVSVATSQGYPIATGPASCSGIGSLLTDIISGVTISRSSQNIQTAVQFSLSFTHPTAMSTTGLISVNFPDSLITEGSGIICQRAVDGATLPCSKTIYNSGAINNLSISGYCAVACPMNNTVNLVLAGLQTLSYVMPITGSIVIITSDHTFLVDQGQISDITTQIPVLSPGSLINISIDQDNPTVGANTAYRVIFTTMHSIPTGALVQIQFPVEVTIPDRSAAASSCSPYILIDSSLQCVVTNSVLTVTNGFVTGYAGSWMVGLKISNVSNAGAIGTSSAFTVSLMTNTGYLIDTGSATVNFYASLVTCSSQCLACAGVSTTCYSCAAPSSYPVQRSFSCAYTCPNNTFLVQNPMPLACITCHYTCSSCTSSLASECINCANGLVKSNRSCLATCPPGTTISNGVCVNSASCASPCMTCSTSSTFCLTCFQSSANPVLDPVNGNCVLMQVGNVHYCPIGYYQSGLTCAPCDPNCQSCLNASSFCTSCKSIYGTPFLNLIDNTCAGSCPVGITVLVGSNCVPCDPSCLTCTGTSSSSCVTCPSSGPKYKTASGQCVASCGNGAYNFDNADGSFACVATCTTTAHYYLDTTTNYCRPCYSDCVTCSGPGSQMCLSCSAQYLTADGQCLATCPSGQFYDTLYGAMKCVYGCPSGTFYFTNSDQTVQCVTSCNTANKFYIDLNSQYCSPCSPTCLTCKDSSTCLSCDLTSVTPFLTADGMCVSVCPTTQFTYTNNGLMNCYGSCPPPTYNFWDSTGKGFCSISCPSQNFFINVTTNFCSPCDQSCLTCSGPSAFNCLTCGSSLPLPTVQNQCVASCPSNMYLYLLNGINTCLLTCPAGTFYYQHLTDPQICVNTCGAGFYLDQGTLHCFICDSSCLTCNGVSSSSCTSCDQSGATPYLSDSNTCLQTCGTLFTYSLNGAMKCYSSCPSDSYNSQSALTALKTCVATCGTGNYIDTTTNYCKPCDPTCFSCSGTTASSCLTCPPTYPYLTYLNQCVTKCPSTMYIYNLNGSMQCLSSCPNGVYNFNNPGNYLECISTCPPGNYIDALNNYCRTCANTCLTCNGISSTNCLSCNPTSGNPYLTDTQQCVAQCPTDSPYLDTVNGAKLCYSVCPVGMYMYDNGQGGNQQCVLTCGSGNFLDQTHTHCRKCDVSCLSCNGTSSSSCTSCDTSGATPYLTDTSQCVAQCPIASYRYTFNSSYLCYSTCPAGYFGFTKADGTLVCVNTCGAGFYLDSTANVCYNCANTCNTCNGLSTSSCLTCDQTGTFPYLTDSGQCVTTCPASLYVFNPNGEQRCVTSCPAGSYNFDNSKGFKQCVLTCGSGFFVDVTLNYCRVCDPSCRTCSGSGYTSCSSCNKSGTNPYLTEDQRCLTECPSTTFLYSPNGEMKCMVTCPTPYYNSAVQTTGQLVCTSTCGNGYYVDTSGNYCRQCYSTCATCSAGTSLSCTSCVSSTPFLTDGGDCVTTCPSQYYSYTLNSQTKCMSICPSGTFSISGSKGKLCSTTCSGSFYVVTGTNNCMPCAANCQTCNGGNACLSCNTSSAFPNLNENGECVSVCSSAEFAYVQAGITQCLLTCPTGTYYLSVGGKQCVATCPIGTYLKSSSCSPCDPSCLECVGPLNTNCPACKSSYAFFNNECLTQCPSGYKNSNGQCVPACVQATCSQCQVQALNTCTTCAAGFILYNATCYSMCPDGTFQSSNTCATCDQSCRTCKGSRNDECTSCPSGSSLYMGRCMTQCPTGLEPIQGQCEVPVPCDSPCTDCVTGTGDLCTSCIDTSPYLIQHQCYSTCPDHYFAGNETSCVECVATCAECVGSPGYCSACSNSTFLTVNHTCSVTCGVGYLANNSTHICDVQPDEPQVIHNITTPAVTQEVSYMSERVYPIAIHVAAFAGCSLLALVSKLYRPDMHISEANLLGLYSAVDMMHRLTLLVTIWQYQEGHPDAYQIAVSAGLLIGSVCLSMMFLILYLDPVVETSAALELFVSQHKFAYPILRICCCAFGLHFVRVLYGGLFGLELFSNYKTLGNSSGFRLPLEKMSVIQTAVLAAPQVIQNLTVLILYAADSDPFQLAAFGIAVNIVIGGLFLFEYLRGPWRVG